MNKKAQKKVDHELCQKMSVHKFLHKFPQIGTIHMGLVKSGCPQFDNLGLIDRGLFWPGGRCDKT
ncbi:MAG: hypothetical protein H6Q04_495 [Acidobacteria bacterium]|nr:hypothetical protein [Acidobacteriota bacterium]